MAQSGHAELHCTCPLLADISVGFSTHVAEMIPARLAVLTDK
jgi:hypothetical protein